MAEQVISEDWVERQKNNFLWAIHRTFRKYKQTPYMGKTIGLIYKNHLRSSLPWLFLAVLPWIFLIVFPSYFFLPVTFVSPLVYYILNMAWLFLNITWLGGSYYVFKIVLPNIAEKSAMSDEELKAIYHNFNYEDLGNTLLLDLDDKLILNKWLRSQGYKKDYPPDKNFAEEVIDMAKKILAKDKSRLDYKTTIDKINEDFDVIELKIKYFCRKEKSDSSVLDFFKKLRILIGKDLQVWCEVKMLFNLCSLHKSNAGIRLLESDPGNPALDNCVYERILYYSLPIKGANLEDTKDENGEIIPGLRTEINRNYDRVREICENIKTQRTPFRYIRFLTYFVRS